MDFSNLKFNPELHSIAPSYSGSDIHAEDGYIEVKISLYVGSEDSLSGVDSYRIGKAYRHGYGKWKFEFRSDVGKSIQRATAKQWREHLEDEGDDYDYITDRSYRSSEYDTRFSYAPSGY